MRLSTVLTVAASVGALLFLAAGPARGQSLGELAAQEAARRKASPPPAKTYTNDDLKKAQGLPDDTAKDAKDGKSSKDGQDAKATPDGKDAKDSKDAKGDDAKDGKAGSTDPAKDEAYWRGRISQARENLRRDQAFADALQSRINALSAEFASRDDPAQRAQVADDRQKALAELDRVKLDIDNTNKSITNIEEEARRAGVPPGWLR